MPNEILEHCVRGWTFRRDTWHVETRRTHPTETWATVTHYWPLPRSWADPWVWWM